MSSRRCSRLIALSTLCAALASSAPGAAEPTDEDQDLREVRKMIAEQTVRRYFLVAGSARSYAGAQHILERVAKRSGLEVDLRGLEPAGRSLSFSREICVAEVGDYPCGIGRGRAPSQESLSIESSAWYSSMKSGYFVVVAANGDRDLVYAAWRKLARLGVPAYVTSERVYMGCMH